ncbi:MAG: ATP-binding protein [bacterium]
MRVTTISIRKRLTLTLLLVIMTIVVAGGMYLYVFFAEYSLSRFDHYLSTKVRTVAAILESDQGDFNYELDKFLPEFERKVDSEYFQIWLEKGKVIRKSRSLMKFNLPRRTGTLNKPEFWDLTLPDGRPGRAVGIHFIYSSDDDKMAKEYSRQPVEIVLASSKNKSKSDIINFGIKLSIGIFLILVAIVLLVPYLVRKGVSPINKLADSVSKVETKSLDIRFSTDDLPKELRPIAEKLNELLVRLEEAFKREKRLTADIAHELKTPLSELITMTEVNLNWPASNDDNKKTLSDVLDIAKQMQTLVSTILTQVRMESKTQRVALEQINISTVLIDLIKVHKKEAESRSLKLESSYIQDLMVESDKPMLYSIINNLLSNAVQYCADKGIISCSLSVREEDMAIILKIRNSNSDLTEEDLPYMFEPMWRKSKARTYVDNSGLGLTLVKSFCDVLSIGLKTELSEDKDFCVTLEFLKNVD